MRIIITADLHYEPARRSLYQDFARDIAAQQPDCFILAGDAGHPLRLFRRCLQLFSDLTCPKLILAGNHDVYVSGAYDSRRLWEHELASVANDEGFLWLEEESLCLGNIGICGTMAWYDYSSAAAHMALDDDAYRRLKPLVNHDADYIDWPWSDRAMARYLQRGFARRLDALAVDPAVAQILIATHIPIFKVAIPDHPESSRWSLIQAYLGNITLGDLVRQQSKVTHVVSGHIHRPGQWSVDMMHGSIDFRIVGSQRGDLRAVSLAL